MIVDLQTDVGRSLFGFFADVGILGLRVLGLEDFRVWVFGFVYGFRGCETRGLEF